VSNTVDGERPDSVASYYDQHDQLQTACCDTVATGPLSTLGDKLSAAVPLPAVIGEGDDILTIYRVTCLYLLHSGSNMYNKYISVSTNCSCNTRDLVIISQNRCPKSIPTYIAELLCKIKYTYPLIRAKIVKSWRSYSQNSTVGVSVPSFRTRI